MRQSHRRKDGSGPRNKWIHGHFRKFPKGLTDGPEYTAYYNAKARCTIRNSKDWKNYGGRGIQFRFQSFAQFYAEVGPRPDAWHTLDRIKTNGHYEPGNVKWATWKENQNNRRNNVKKSDAGLLAWNTRVGQYTRLLPELEKAKLANWP